MDGSWPNTLGTPRPMGPSGCWRCTTGTRTRFAPTCKGLRPWSIWAIPEGLLVVAMRRDVSQARPKVGGGKATVQRHGGEGGELSDRSIPGTMVQPSRRDTFWTGSSTYPRNGRRTGCGGRKPVCRKGWPSAPKHNWPKG